MGGPRSLKLDNLVKFEDSSQTAGLLDVILVTKLSQPRIK
jgi:hypothetical protein